MVKRHALKPLNAAVGLECLSELDHARHVLTFVGEAVAGETVHKKGETEVSVAADTFRRKRASDTAATAGIEAGGRRT